MRSYLIFVLGLWAALVVGFAAPAQVVSTEVWVLLFAESLLPLVNAVFDYLSYGITLGLIQVGRRKRNFMPAIIWIAGRIAAVALLIGLGLALCGTIVLINYLAGQNFIALRPIFDDLKPPEGRMEYSWLIWALLSTLVPTLVHLVLLFLSAFTWVPHRFKM